MKTVRKGRGTYLSALYVTDDSRNGVVHCSYMQLIVNKLTNYCICMYRRSKLLLNSRFPAGT